MARLGCLYLTVILALFTATGCQNKRTATAPLNEDAESSSQRSTTVKAITKPKAAQSTVAVSGASGGSPVKASANTKLVTGKITLSDGASAAGTTVTFYVADQGASGPSVVVPWTSAQADDKGIYALTVPATMALFAYLEATKEDYGAVGRQFWLPSLDVKDESEKLLNLTLKPAIPVQGQVVDSSGRPVSGAIVRAQAWGFSDNSSYANSTQAATTTTTIDGQFRINKFSSPKLELLATADDHTFAQLTVRAPEDHVRIVLGAGGASISGRVSRKETGGAVSSATVHLFMDLTPQKPLLGSVLIAEADSSGAFKMDHIPSGKYTIRARAESLQLWEPLPAFRLNGDETSGGYNMLMYGGYTISGVAKDMKAGKPLQGVEVWDFYRPAKLGGSLAKSDAAGSFTLCGVFPLYEQNATLIAKYDAHALIDDGSYNSGFASVKLPKDRLEIQRDLVFSPNLTISGIVQTADGMPMGDAKVSKASGSAEEMALAVVTDSGGRFTIPAPPFATIQLKAEVSDYPQAMSAAIRTADAALTGTKIVVKAGCRIEGVVVSPDGSAVPQARVTAQPMTRDYRAGTMLEAKSDAKGAFVLAGISSGETAITAQAKDFVSSETLILSLKSGETTSGIRILMDGTHYIAGRVLDTEQRPLAGIPLGCRAAVLIGGTMPAVVTDENGRYRIENLRAGTTDVWAGTDEYLRVTRSAVAVDQDNVDFVLKKKTMVSFLGRVVDAKSNKPVDGIDVTSLTGGAAEVDPNEPGRFTIKEVPEETAVSGIISAKGYAPLQVNVTVPAGQPTYEQMFLMSPASSVVGRVLDKSTRAPVGGVRVTLKNLNRIDDFENPMTDIGRMAGKVISTSNDGRFRIEGATGGNNTVQFDSEPPYADFTLDVVCESGQQADMGDVYIDSGGTITGMVVRMPGEKPVPEVRLNIQGNAMSNATGVSNIVTTDDQGHFEFTGLPNDSYTIFSADRKLSAHVLLEVSQKKEIVLRLGSAVLKARVIKAGQPIRATISLSQGTYGQSSSLGTATDEQGEATIAEVSPGKWNVTIRADDTRSISDSVEIPDSGTVEKTFTFPSGKLVGTVVDAERKPVGKVTVSAKGGATSEAWNSVLPYDYGNTHRAQSDANGNFTISNIPPGKYTVRATHASAGQASVENVEVPLQGDSQLVRLILKPVQTGKLESIALNMSTGGPIKEAWCILWNGDEKFNHSAQRDDNGVMTIPDIPEGKYRVQVSSFGFAVVEHDITIEAGKTVKLEDVLYDAGAVRFSVQDKNGAAIPNVACTLVADDPKSIEQPRQGNTDASGLWVVRGLFPGSYSATASVSGYTPGKGNVTVQAHQPVDLVIKLN